VSPREVSCRQDISYRLCALLDNAGHQAVHVDQFSLGAAEDVAILDFARSGKWVVVTSDTDFGTLLAAQRATAPSVILTREVSTLPVDDLARLLIVNLSAFDEALMTGAVVAISPRGIRVRRLPLR
jgi:predicted nuclease of predicted toxin-antitoxin system